MNGEKCQKREQIAQQIVPAFAVDGQLAGVLPYGNGHINDTFAAYFQMNDGSMRRTIIQRINTDVFKNPDELMENVIGVTSFLKKRILEEGGNPERETLTVIPTKDEKSYMTDSQGNCWRCYSFVEDTVTYQMVEKPEDFYTVARAFGHFQMLLADYPAHTLHETIPLFHDTPNRYRNFIKALKEDNLGRAANVQKEIDFVREREAFTHLLTDLQKKGELPLRVTHNDTKLNNILIDKATGRGLCVIDLDTVMPGLALNDYGDSIRFGASTALEDEQDLDKVSMDLQLFELFTKGFLETAGRVLTDKEIEMLPAGAKMMTLECGMRFLTDYLEGDTYFKIHREGHNLDRARTQFKLVYDMEQKWAQMQAIVQKYAGR
ncbi:MAG: aminoglycoside phosphotransferase family protein [Provencibacterium sp.]|nr:aminoglycoside phosphotransferase family protein [Provencibacterium sp.]